MVHCTALHLGLRVLLSSCIADERKRYQSVIDKLKHQLEQEKAKHKCALPLGLLACSRLHAADTRKERM